MKEKMLMQLREELKKSLKSQEEYNRKVDRILLLQQSPDVCEYLQLTSTPSKKFSHSEKTQEQMIRDIYKWRKIDRSETNGIFVYIGAYIERCSEDNDYYKCITEDDDPNALWKDYWDIELEEKIEVPIDRCDDFEKNNFVIRLPKKCANRIAEQFYREETHKIIQNEFFKDAILNSQEEAVRHVLKKYKAH